MYHYRKKDDDNNIDVGNGNKRWRYHNLMLIIVLFTYMKKNIMTTIITILAILSRVTMMVAEGENFPP